MRRWPGCSRGSQAVAFYSALTGGRLESPVLDADYWYRSLREPVAFAAASRCLLADGYRFFVEASPHPAACGAAGGNGGGSGGPRLW